MSMEDNVEKPYGPSGDGNLNDQVPPDVLAKIKAEMDAQGFGSGNYDKVTGQVVDRPTQVVEGGGTSLPSRSERAFPASYDEVTDEFLGRSGI